MQCCITYAQFLGNGAENVISKENVDNFYANGCNEIGLALSEI